MFFFYSFKTSGRGLFCYKIRDFWKISTSVIAVFQLLYFRSPFLRHCGSPGVKRADDWSQHNGEITNIQRNWRLHPAVYLFWVYKLSLYIVASIAGLKIKKAGLVTIEARNSSTVHSFNRFKTKWINPFFL